MLTSPERVDYRNTTLFCRTAISPRTGGSVAWLTMSFTGAFGRLGAAHTMNLRLGATGAGQQAPRIGARRLWLARWDRLRQSIDAQASEQRSVECG